MTHLYFYQIGRQHSAYKTESETSSVHTEFCSNFEHCSPKMGKIYQILVVGIKGEKKTVDVATSEEEFNTTTILQFKKKVAEKLPGPAGKIKC